MSMKLRCCTITLLTFVLIMAFSGSPAEGFLVDVHIYGQVLGHVSEDGERRPISGARVSIDFDGTVLGTITDPSGYYSIENLVDISAAEYTVVADADLCDPDEHVVVVSKGWNGDEDLLYYSALMSHYWAFLGPISSVLGPKTGLSGTRSSRS